MRRIISIVVLMMCEALFAVPYECGLDVSQDIRVRVSCAKLSGWRVSAEVRRISPEVAEVVVDLDAASELQPPSLTVSWDMPQRDCPHYWCSEADVYGIPPIWGRTNESDIAHEIPVYSFFSDANENRLTIAACDSVRRVAFKPSLVEETCSVACKWTFFPEKVAPSKKERIRIRFDTRAVFWSDAVVDATAWIVKAAGLKPLHAPKEAFAPVYSTWYAFHQSVFADTLEKELELASRLGMKTVILDEGWETDDTGRGFAFSGDWEVTTNRFPDLKAHVRKVQAMGMKYVLWLGLPFVGPRTKAYEIYKDRCLLKVRREGTRTLDPRFPEIRKHLCDVVESRMLAYGIDGVKIDFIDTFQAGVECKPGDGRDIPDIPSAVDALMSGVLERMMKFRDSPLVEFRQVYIGPAICQYGNMIRASDCPGDMVRNRRSIARLRLTSGGAAVHGDMLEWHPTDTAENAARCILNSIFGVVQYSVVLGGLPPDHLKMIGHWIRFSTRHEEALLHGRFRPFWPQNAFPLLEGESDDERIVGVYNSDLVVVANPSAKKTYVLNATEAKSLVVDLKSPAEVRVFNVFGELLERIPCGCGVQRVRCSPSGYLELAAFEELKPSRMRDGNAKGKRK